MQDKIFLVFVACSVVFTTGCDRPSAPDCFKTAGDQAIEQRSFSQPIRTLAIDDLLEVRIFETDGPERIDIVGPANLLSKVRTSQDGSVVNVYNDNTCNFVRDLSIRLQVNCYVHALERLEYNGQGDLYFVDTLHTDVFTFESLESAGDVVLRLAVDSMEVLCHSGLSNFQIEGEARIAGLFNQGMGKMNAANLQAEAVLCRQASINSMKVRATAYLYAVITSRGDLFYAGEPADVEQVISGSGALIPLGE